MLRVWFSGVAPSLFDGLELLPDLRVVQVLTIKDPGTVGEWMFGVLSKDLYSGLAKALVFGLIIGGLSCSFGMRASGGALGVGNAVRGSVVASVVATLVVGYLITWFFWVVLA